MIDKIKKYVKENKFDLIEKGSIVIGSILGILVIAVAISVKKDAEPFEDIVEIDI